MPVSKPEPYPSPAAEGFSDINNRLMTTIASPGREPMQDNFFINNIINHHADSDSMDLLSQLQAIKLVTEASNYTGHQTISLQFHNQYSLPLSSPSPSSSSTCSTTAQEKSALAFSWRDFLLEDAFLPADHHPQVQEDEILEFSSEDFVPQSHSSNGTSAEHIENNNTNNSINGVQGMDGVPSYGFHASSSTENSFVAAMLDQEKKMFSEFEDLLEDPCY